MYWFLSKEEQLNIHDSYMENSIQFLPTIIWVAYLSQICPASHYTGSKSVFDSSGFIRYYWRKNDNEEYFKIKTVEEEVRNVLTDGKVLLQFVIAAIIEVLRRNSDRYNDLLAHNMSSSTAVPTQETLPLHNEDYKIMILEESNKLYNELIKELVNKIMSDLNPPKTSLSSWSSNLERLPYSPATYGRK